MLVLKRTFKSTARCQIYVFVLCIREKNRVRIIRLVELVTGCGGLLTEYDQEYEDNLQR